MASGWAGNSSVYKAAGQRAERPQQVMYGSLMAYIPFFLEVG